MKDSSKSKRILFLIPPYFNAEDYLKQDRAAVLPAFTIPYGILSLEAYITENCNYPVEVDICDLNITLDNMINENTSDDYQGTFKAEIATFLEKKPDIVGVSALFNSSGQYIKELVRFVKNYDPNIMTIAGGGLPSADYAKLLNICAELDAICKGEGELPMVELLNADDPQQVLKDHPSWITRSGLAVGKVPEHDFIENLDEIPFFNYDKVDLNFYNRRSINKKHADEVRREMSIHTSRGCPFKCVFCSNPSLHGYKMRTMSLERVKEEITLMKEEYGMTDLLVEDDHFFHSQQRAKKILEMLVDIDVRVEFPNGIAVYGINDEISALFSKAGVGAVALAVESGSSYVLNKIIKKPLKKDMIKPAINSLRKHNVRTHVFIVVGLPGETDEHRQETLNTLLYNGFDWVHMYIAMPIVGSRLYDICVDNGYIAEETSENYVATKSVIRAPGIEPKQIEKFVYHSQLIINFVNNPNMRLGNWEIAIDYLKNVCTKYPDHALGHYYIAQCYEKIGEEFLAASHEKTANAIFQRDPFWAEFKAKYVDGDFQAGSLDSEADEIKQLQVSQIGS